ncbi:MAG: hypothetical protein O2815_06095 [Actinomycetota bacterium]|nr:hypothetical protein [Actinomycetota bacterium]
MSTLLGCHAGHSRAGKPVEYDVSWHGVVENEPHDRRVRHLRRIRVRLVEGIALSFAHVRCEWTRVHPTIVAWPIEGFEPVGDEWVRACRVVRRVGHGEDVLVASLWEPGELADIRQAPPQLLTRSSHQLITLNRIVRVPEDAFEP